MVGARLIVTTIESLIDGQIPSLGVLVYVSVIGLLKIDMFRAVYVFRANVPLAVVVQVQTAFVPEVDAGDKSTLSPSQIVISAGTVTVGVVFTLIVPLSLRVIVQLLLLPGYAPLVYLTLL